MRHYDTQLTPTTQKSYQESGDNRYPETDERVANWFNPSTFEVDGIMTEHTRSFDEDGFPVLTAITPPTQAEMDAVEADRADEEARQVERGILDNLDKLSMRDIREMVAALPNAPQTLIDHEANAIAARLRLTAI